MDGSSSAGEQARGGDGEQREGEDGGLSHFSSRSYTPRMFVDDLKNRPTAVPTRFRRFPLHSAIAGDRADMVQFLLDEGYDMDLLDDDGRLPLQQAAIIGNDAAARVLLAAGTCVGFRCTCADMSALDYAAERGSLSVAKAIVEHGVDVNATGTDGTALHHATEGGHEITSFLLANGAAVDALDGYGSTALHGAALSGDMAVTQALLDGGADINVKDGDGDTALDCAIIERSVETARVIIAHGAEHGVDINIKTEGRAVRDALHLAAESNTAEVVEALVGAGVNTDDYREEDDRNTPLHTALAASSFSAALSLLNHGASVTERNAQGYTPLHLAAATAGPYGTARIVDLLLRKGADEKATTDNGETPADVVGSQVRQHNRRLINEAGEVRKLLANAPADRAWRRRSLLVLSRACYLGSSGVQLRPEVIRTHADIASLAGPSNAEAEWAGVASMLMGVGADPISRMGDGADVIFKTIMGYL